MIKTRDEFIKNHWLRYPEMPQRALKWGRIEQHYLGTQDIGLIKLVNYPANGIEVEASSILIEGDLVCLMPNQQMVLLAPNLTNKKVKDLSWVQYKQWLKFLATVKAYFIEKSFLEIKTPTLVKCPGTEPSIEVFETQFQHGSKIKNYYLPTSPELNLKKLLAQGAEKIFEVAPVFRNGEKTDRHEPEFLMLEWYRSFSHLSRIKIDTVDLIEYLAEKLNVEKPVGQLSLSIPDLFKQHCQFDLTPNTTVEDLKSLAEKLNIDVSAASCIDDYFYLIFIEKIENKWPQDHLVFIEKYPPYQAALARLGKDGWAERFEVYWQGLELANAFHELNDPQVQKMRALEDLEKKKHLGKKVVNLDEDFFAALELGLPPSAGIALGLERLYMAFYKIKQISLLNQIYGN